MLLGYLIVFAVVVIAGGIQGFVSKGSLASIIAASVIGAVALAAAYLLGKAKTGSPRFMAALVLASLAFFGVAGRFGPAFFKAGDKALAIWPAAVLGLMGLLGLVLVVLEARRSKV